LAQRYVSEMHVSNILRKNTLPVYEYAITYCTQRTHLVNAKPNFLNKSEVIPVLATWKTSSSDTEQFGIESTQVESDWTK